MGLSAQATRRGPKLNLLFQILTAAAGLSLFLLAQDALSATNLRADPNPTSGFQSVTVDTQYAAGRWAIASGGDASW